MAHSDGLLGYVLGRMPFWVGVHRYILRPFLCRRPDWAANGQGDVT
jgi:hypothetical protein